MHSLLSGARRGILELGLTVEGISHFKDAAVGIERIQMKDVHKNIFFEDNHFKKKNYTK